MSATTRLSKILIANRGEIACRVMRSAKRLGVNTVAVYSDADKQSLHVSMADEAYHIGKPPAQESYLQGYKLIKIAKDSKAVAIHPGYGFLSENAEFAELCKKEGVIFIGPPPSAIRDMGIKSTSKAIMIAAGVPVIPGYHGDDQSMAKLKEEAVKIGFPLMIKAVRGGGGKGMRIVHSESDFESGLDSARRESMKSFGDDVVLLERYVSRPRHIEVQVFADHHGNCVHLFERDCSVQRRHQKIIEQAPAPGIERALRMELGEAAVRAAKAVNYVGAGTVEFIMDTDTNKFYFMEMNTRLQVEHPVTEMVTGIDLVEWQLRIASGEDIPVKQEDIRLNGHSVEARIYAEDVNNGFIPTAGPLEQLTVPSSPQVRVEIGVTEGDDVSVHYDPMIAKLIVWDLYSDGAFNKLESALRDFNIVGIENNVDFLRSLCRNDELKKGNVHTGFIDEHKETLMNRTPENEIFIQAALATVLCEKQKLLDRAAKTNDPFSPFVHGSTFRLNHDLLREFKFKHDKKDYIVKLTLNADGSYSASVNNENAVRVSAKQMNGDDGFAHLTLFTDTHISKTKLSIRDNLIYIFGKSGNFKLSLEKDFDWDSLESGTDGDSSNQAVSPMPGILEKLHVKPGDKVKKGDPVAVVMAMKMEHIIRAERDGTVISVRYKEGENIGKNVPLVKFGEE